ncbi:MAG: AI-2E family transporter [Acidobacteriota bacterium]|jgi:predicted PurR-regulated permease PerM
MKRPDPAVLRLLVFGGGLIAVTVLLIIFSNIFLPLLLGLGIAYLLDPPVSWLERKRWSRLWAVVALALVLVLAVTGFFLYLVPAMGEEFQRLGQRFPEYTERLREQFEPLLQKARARYPEEFVDLRDRAIETARENLPKLASSVGKWLGNVFDSVRAFLLFLLNLVFVPVFGFYLLVDFPKVKRGMRDMIPLPYREIVLARLQEVDQAVASFLRGQLTIALILAFINATGLVLIGVPLGLVLGITAGLANMIPYMSLIVGLLPATLLCWAEHGSLLRVILVVAVFSGAQMLEGMVLSPRILGKSVNLHPVWVLLAIIIGGSLFGIFGMLIAVPAAAAIQVFMRHWLESYRASKVYRGEGRPARSGDDLPPGASPT